MAGSYKHCIKIRKDGTYGFRGVELLDHLRDAYEALQEMFDMIEHLSGGDKAKILEAHEAHCRKRYGGVHNPQTVEQFFAYDGRLDELQRLHEAATPGEWCATDDGRVITGDGDTLFHDDSVLVSSENEMAQAAALHNAWPAIHRVLVAAMEVTNGHVWTNSQKIQGLVEALRAFDGEAKP